MTHYIELEYVFRSRLELRPEQTALGRFAFKGHAMSICLRCESAEAEKSCDFCGHCKSMRTVKYTGHLNVAAAAREPRSQRERRLYGQMGAASEVRAIDPATLQDPR